MATVELNEIDLLTLSEVFAPHVRAAQLAQKLQEQLQAQASKPPPPPETSPNG